SDVSRSGFNPIQTYCFPQRRQLHCGITFCAHVAGPRYRVRYCREGYSVARIFPGSDLFGGAYCSAASRTGRVVQEPVSLPPVDERPRLSTADSPRSNQTPADYRPRFGFLIGKAPNPTMGDEALFTSEIICIFAP